jgi:hypothetical protein
VNLAFSFFNDLDLFIQYLPGEPVNSDVNPVPLLAFHHEVLRIGGPDRVPARLGDNVDHQVPDPRIAHSGKGPDKRLAESVNILHCGNLGWGEVPGQSRGIEA